MKKVVCILLLSAFLGSLSGLQAQSPYHFSPALDLPLSLGGLGLSGTGHLLQWQTPGLTEAEITALDPAGVPSFDRYALRHLSEGAGAASDWLVYAGAAGGASLILDREVRSRFWGIALMGLETIALTDGFTSLSKAVVLRPRPFVYQPEADLGGKLTANARFSFFSGHTSFAACVSFFSAKVYSDLHPGSKARLPVWIAAATLPAVTGFLRMQAGKHYLSDVLAGYAAGALIGFGIPALHKAKWTQRMSLSAGPGQMVFVWRF